ncbi:MAG: efflux RND transporter permease subunit [Marinifilaceae bacterium]
MFKLSSYTIICIFVVFTLLGIGMLPHISLQLQPTIPMPQFTVSYSWRGVSSELIEYEVTSKLEGVLSTVNGLTNIQSESSVGRGKIEMLFKQNVDVDATKLYISSLIRSMRDKLPHQLVIDEISTSNSNISNNTDYSEQRILLEYELSGIGDPYEVKKYIEDYLVKEIDIVEGVNNIEIKGLYPRQYHYSYNLDQLRLLELEPSDITNTINRHKYWKAIGKVTEHSATHFVYSYLNVSDIKEPDDILKLPIKQINKRIIRIGDVVKTSIIEAEKKEYSRVNGADVLTMNIYVSPESNSVIVGNNVKRIISELMQMAQSGYRVQLIQDNSLVMKNEIYQILFKTLWTIILLLLFVYIVDRDVRQLIYIFLSLCANIFIAIFFYYCIGLNVNLYTLAGINISFGILVDNIILMNDHYRYNWNKKIFISIFAATLTTISALLVTLSIDNREMMLMRDFMYAVIINLAVSLLVALFLIPALLENTGQQYIRKRSSLKNLRKVINLSWYYKHLIISMYRWRIIVFISLIIMFGIPINIIPDKLSVPQRSKQYTVSSAYNAFMDLDYVKQGRMFFKTYLCGSLGLFGRSVYQRKDKEKIVSLNNGEISVTLEIPHNAPIRHMNEAMLQLEKFLSTQTCVDIYKTTISSANQATLKISLKESYVSTSNVLTLCDELFYLANQIGNVYCHVSASPGIEKDNKILENGNKSEIVLRGYNYRLIKEQAEKIAHRLQQYKRVTNVSIASSFLDSRSSIHQFIPNKHKLAFYQITPSQLTQTLQSLNGMNDSKLQLEHLDVITDINIEPTNANTVNFWKFNNTSISALDGGQAKIMDLGTLNSVLTSEVIQKENQEYKIKIYYKFKGESSQRQDIQDKVLGDIEESLPLGFSIGEKRNFNSYGWKKIGTIDQRVLYILLVITIILIISAILLNSWKQALSVISVIPVSYIGMFLSFWIFRLQFNDGGLIAFILISGISVNATLYIVNEYNILVRKKKKCGIDIYLHAFQAKIIPILLTITSTILGFIPFLINNHSPFWNSLISSIITGLIFSLIALFFVFPLFWKWDDVNVEEIDFVSYVKRIKYYLQRGILRKK